jgi:hypothetical protein
MIRTFLPAKSENLEKNKADPQSAGVHPPWVSPTWQTFDTLARIGLRAKPLLR